MATGGLTQVIEGVVHDQKLDVLRGEVANRIEYSDKGVKVSTSTGDGAASTVFFRPTWSGNEKSEMGTIIVGCGHHCLFALL